MIPPLVLVPEILRDLNLFAVAPKSYKASLAGTKERKVEVAEVATMYETVGEDEPVKLPDEFP